MPKKVEPEYDSMKRADVLDALVEPDAEKQKFSQRELARLKKKRALALKVQGESTQSETQTPEPETSARSAKKTKSGAHAENADGRENGNKNGGADVINDIPMNVTS